MATYLYRKNNRIFYIGKGQVPNLDLKTLLSKEYDILLKELKHTKEGIIYLIVDEVESSDSQFWLEYYCDLYKSWGFLISLTCFKSNIDTFKIEFVNNIGKQLLNGKKTISKYYQTNSSKYIYLLVSDMLAHQGINKTFDELLLFLLLSILEGEEYSELMKLNFLQLSYAINRSNMKRHKVYFPKAKYFLENFNSKHCSPTYIKDEKVFTKINKSPETVNRAVIKLFLYFGYNVKYFNIIDLKMHFEYINWINITTIQSESNQKYIYPPYNMNFKMNSSTQHDLSHNLLQFISIMRLD